MPNAAPTLLDFPALDAWASATREEYAAADPFAHVFHPSFLPPEALSAVCGEFPQPGEIENWRRNEAKDQHGRVAQAGKLGYSDELALGAALRTLLYELNSARFLKILEKLTGIEGLIGDPYFFGAGLHQYLPGSVLMVHADFNRHPVWAFDRRLNLLLYLNENWDPAWGGEVELWDRSMSRCVRRFPPVANSAVIFSTGRDSFHGMPDPLRCPAGTTRKSVALYYYTAAPPEAERAAEHSTLWRARPQDTP